VTIEFQCGHCHKPLKTTDEKAGRQAKCPGCGGVIEIPSVEGNFISELSHTTLESTSSDSATSIPLVFSKTKPCPSCAEDVEVFASRCQFCGVQLQKGQSELRRPQFSSDFSPFPPDEVIVEAWRIFLEQLGLLVGSFLATSILTFVALMISATPFALAEMFFNRDEVVGAAIAACVGVLLSLAALGFAVFLQCGYLKMLLKVTREQTAEFGDLFTGGPYFFRMLLNSILFSLFFSAGLMMCVVPGVLFAFMFWPFAHLVIDDDGPGLYSLTRAKQLTDRNWGSLFIVFLVAIACIFAGYCTCLIGLIVAVPFVNLLYTVAYDRMSRQVDHLKQD
jgi:uncharacterized membrane protein